MPGANQPIGISSLLHLVQKQHTVTGPMSQQCVQIKANKYKAECLHSTIIVFCLCFTYAWSKSTNWNQQFASLGSKTAHRYKPNEPAMRSN
jgi:hypothetical protein